MVISWPWFGCTWEGREPGKKKKTLMCLNVQRKVKEKKIFLIYLQSGVKEIYIYDEIFSF